MSAIAGLVRFLLRSQPLRATALLIFLTAALVVGLTVTLQILQISPEALAAAATADAEYAMPLAGEIPLGSSGADADTRVVQSVKATGASTVEIGYQVSRAPVDSSGIKVNLVEMDWSAPIFADKYSIVDGRLPARPGEVAVSAVIGAEAPIGSQLSLMSGGLDLEVVGIVRDETSRDSALGLLWPGSWNSLESLGAAADRFELVAARTVFWSGAEPLAVADAVSAALAADVDARLITTDELMGALLNRAEILRSEPAGLVELSLAVLVGPAVSAFFGTWLAGRFVRRIRATLLTIGVYRTRFAGLSAIAIAGLGAALLGSLLGLAAVLTAQPFLDSRSNNATSTPEQPALTILQVCGASAVGLGLGLLSLREPMRARAATSARTRTLTAATASVGLAFIAFFLGTILAATTEVDQLILATMCFGLSVVFLGPLVILWASRWSTTSLASLLGLRRLASETGATSRATVALSALLLVSFTSMTLYASSYDTINAQTESRVPVGQLWFEAQLPPEDAQSIRDEIEDLLGVSDPVEFQYADAASTLQDGATLIVSTSSDLERLIGVELSPGQESLLEGGGTLRTKEPADGDVTYQVSASGSSFVLPSMLISGLDPSYLRLDGFILASTASENSVTGVRSVAAYTDPTATQLENSTRAAQELRFESEWLEAHQAPDVITQPLRLTLIASLVVLLGGLVIGYYAASSSRALRPRLAALRAIGLSRSWLTQTLAVQVGVLITTALVMASIGAVAATALMTLRGSFAFDVSVPWLTLTLETLGLLALAVIATAASTHKLHASERLEQGSD